MLIAKKCSFFFSPLICSRGNDYYKSGAVKIIHHNSTIVFAEVTGTYEYEVRLKWIPGEEPCDIILDTYCNCPYFEENDLCKHVWATILKSEELEFARYAIGKRIDDVEVSDEYEIDEDWADYHSGTLAEDYKDLKKHDNVIQLNSQWKKLLSDVHYQTERTASDEDDDRLKRLCYFIDIDSTMKEDFLVIKLYQQEQKKNKDWGVLKARRIDTIEIGSFFDPQDRYNINLLSSFDNHNLMYSYYYNNTRFSNVNVPLPLTTRILPELSKTDRLFYFDKKSEQKQLIWQGEHRYIFKTVITLSKDKKALNVKGKFTCENRSIPINDIDIIFRNGFIIEKNNLAIFEPVNLYPLISYLFENDSLEVDIREKDEFFENLLENVNINNVEFSKDLNVKKEFLKPKSIITLNASSKNKIIYFYGKISFEYENDISFDKNINIRPFENIIKTENNIKSDGVFDMTIHLRNMSEENKAIDVIKTHKDLISDFNSHDNSFSFEQNKFHKTIDFLIDNNFEVRAEGKKIKTAGTMNISVKSGVDWFDVSSNISFDGAEFYTIPDILKLAKTKSNYFILNDGSYGILPSKWMNKIERLAKLSRLEDGQLRIKDSQAFLLDSLLLDIPDVKYDKKFTEAKQLLKSHNSLKPIDPPKSFMGSLREYQKDGLSWLDFLNKLGINGCLADDMGLGKTIQVLAFLEKKRAQEKQNFNKPSLVIAPKSVIHNWISEAKKFSPQLKLLLYDGANRDDYIKDFNSTNLIIMSYGIMRRDILKLKDFEFDYIILDEAQSIKNRNSQTCKGAKVLRADNRLALSGTPIENHIGELFSIFDFLNPGLLGKFSLPKNINAIEDESISFILNGLKPFILRRTKSEVLTELPEKSENTIYCELETKQKETYDRIKKYYQSQMNSKIKKLGFNKSKIHILEGLLRLRQVACHPKLIDEKYNIECSSKLDLLINKLVELSERGHKALVFSQFTTFLSIVRNLLDKKQIEYEYLDGQTRDREKRILNFQNNQDCKVFLISLKAGGLGLNLTSADYVFILDPWWNPAVENQAIDRTHRIGQTRKVMVYKLVSKNTIEEKILELQEKKKLLSDSVLTVNGSFLKKLDSDDFQYLLS